MISSKLIIRPATAADLIAWYGAPPPYTVTALVGELEGKVVAIGGVYRDANAVVGIAGVAQEMRQRKKDLIRMIRAVKELLQKYPVVLTFADVKEPTADSFIRHLGFEYVKPTPQGDLYQCRRK
jgi:hypothetical protein